MYSLGIIDAPNKEMTSHSQSLPLFRQWSVWSQDFLVRLKYFSDTAFIKFFLFQLFFDQTLST